MNLRNPQIGFDLPARLPAREDRRSVDLCGWFRRGVDGSYWDFRITNLSYGGCRFQSDAPLTKGEKVKLCVQRRGNIEGTVCWRRGDAYGLSFQIEEPQKVHWPRKGERHAFDTPALLRRSGCRSRMVDAKDVSMHGCCLQLTDLLIINDMVWVKLPGLEALEAKVRWTKDFTCGVNFTHSIHPSVFDLLLTRGNRTTTKLAA